MISSTSALIGSGHAIASSIGLSQMAQGVLLCEHSLSGEVAGPAVDASWIPVAFAVGHAGWPMYVAGAVMPVSQAESSIMCEAWWASRHPGV